MSSTKKYTLTPEHRAQLGPWLDRWIANAMSTRPMGDAERSEVREAIGGLYRAANLEVPPDHRIIFVASPFVARFAAGFAAAIWWLRDHATYAATYAATDAATRDATYAATYAATSDATYAAMRDATSAATRDATYAATSDATYAAMRDATSAATSAATSDATSAATRDATYAATSDATYAAMRDATSAATSAATRAATRDATDAATRDATYAAMRDATSAATSAATSDALWRPDLSAGMVHLAKSLDGPNSHLLLSCASSAHRLWNGGNQWSGWVSFISFFRHVAGLALDYSKWRHYETAAKAGPRLMHAKFCIVSERPIKLTVDDQNRPHCDDGPFCEWGDGTKLYSVHGVRVPGYVVERPESITVAQIDSETNAEVKRIMIDRYGLSRYVRDSKFEVLDEDLDPLGQPRRLLQNGRLTIVELTNSTEDGDGSRRKYHVACHPELRPLHADGTLGAPQRLTALAAVASTYGLRAEEYVLEQET
jgi:hypothetical protein